MASHVALLETKKTNENDNQHLNDVKNHHDLSKKKVKILEEELEKSLQTSQVLEDTIQANRKKFNQLVDLIKDIWQEEVQNTSNNNGPLSTTLSQHGIQDNFRGNDGSKTATTVHNGPTARLKAVVDTVSDLNQTLMSGNNGNATATRAAADVPMPISWLSDISEHIKTLKEMNDFQTDEVFQIVNMLHNSEQQKKQDSADEMRWGTRNNGDSNSTEEDEKPSC